MQIVHCSASAHPSPLQSPSTVLWMSGFYWERVCKLESERGKSLGNSEEKQRTKGRLVLSEHSEGSLRARQETMGLRIAEVS